MGEKVSRSTIKITITVDPDSKQLKQEAKKAKAEEKRLRAQVNTMVQKAKAQIKQLYRVYGTESPAVKALKQRGTTLSVKGKNYQELQSTYFSLDKFLKAQTSTVQGAERVLNQTAQVIGEKEVNANTIKKLAETFFEIASKAQQTLQSKEGYWGGSYRVFDAIRQVQQEAGAKWREAQTIEEKAKVISDRLSDKNKEVKQKNEQAKYVEKVEKSIESWLK